MKKCTTILLMAAFMLISLSGFSQCPAPTGLASSYGNNVSTFTWAPVANAIDYRFEIDWKGGYWEYGEEIAPGNTYSFTGLMQGGEYQWRVRANCGNGFSAYTVAYYNTPCIAPINLNTTNITTNSATLNWMPEPNTNNNNTGYSVSYRLANTNNAWIQMTDVYNNPTATFFNLTGLLAGTFYEWRVRRICAVPNSNYMYSQFSTLSCISNGSNASEWIDLFQLGSINRISNREPGGYANVQSNTNLTIGTNGITGLISAGFPSGSRNERYSIYIDFNRNGSFADAGEKLIDQNNINSAGNFGFAINIPANVTAGPTRMRVIMKRSGGNIDPCITGYYGETEDYNVNLVTNGNMPSFNTDSKPEVLSRVSALNIGEGDATFRVSPNPTNGIIDIRFTMPTDAVAYEIINGQGQPVQQGKISNKYSWTADLSNAAAGIYFIKVIYQSGRMEYRKIQKL
jgi:hypothetical protein